MYQVSGLMLASHTGIRHLFSKCLTQYDKLRKRQAFLDNYRNHPTFAVSSVSTLSFWYNLLRIWGGTVYSLVIGKLVLIPAWDLVLCLAFLLAWLRNWLVKQSRHLLCSVVSAKLNLNLKSFQVKAVNFCRKLWHVFFFTIVFHFQTYFKLFYVTWGSSGNNLFSFTR